MEELSLDDNALLQELYNDLDEAIKYWDQQIAELQEKLKSDETILEYAKSNMRERFHMTADHLLESGCFTDF